MSSCRPSERKYSTVRAFRPTALGNMEVEGCFSKRRCGIGVDWWEREREVVRPAGPPPIIRMGCICCVLDCGCLCLYLCGSVENGSVGWG